MDRLPPAPRSGSTTPTAVRGAGRGVGAGVDWVPWAGLAARLVVGVVWVWAGLLKLPDPAASIEAVRAYELLPASMVEPVGYLLPVLEVVIGASLVVGLLTRGSALLSGVLLVAFIIGISAAWARGLEIDCGCFGDGGANPDAASQYPWEIARDVGLLALSIFLVRFGPGRLALDSRLFRGPPDSPVPPSTATEGS